MNNYSIEEDIWKDIEGYEGYYQVSNLSKVRSLDREVISGNRVLLRKGKILTFKTDAYGYLVTNLHKDKKRKEYKVHRLVAQCFIPNVESKPYINHIDGNKKNNNLYNLEWCTPKENMIHSAENNLNNRNKSVEKYSLDGKLLKTYYSVREAGRDLGIAYNNISNVCKGKQKTAGGYCWKYAK